MKGIEKVDELPKRVLYAFYPDKFRTFEQIVSTSGVSLPFVRNTINKSFIPDGYVEEVLVTKKGQKHNYFHLTAKGKIAVAQIHSERQWLRERFAELLASGLTPAEAAMQAAAESVETDKLTS